MPPKCRLCRKGTTRCWPGWPRPPGRCASCRGGGYRSRDRCRGQRDPGRGRPAIGRRRDHHGGAPNAGRRGDRRRRLDPHVSATPAARPRRRPRRRAAHVRGRRGRRPSSGSTAAAARRWPPPPWALGRPGRRTCRSIRDHPAERLATSSTTPAPESLLADRACRPSADRAGPVLGSPRHRHREPPADSGRCTSTPAPEPGLRHLHLRVHRAAEGSRSATATSPTSCATSPTDSARRRRRAVLWSTTFTFDISALELFLPLATGGTVVVAPDDALPTPRALLDLSAADVSRRAGDTDHAGGSSRRRPRGDSPAAVLLCGGEPLPAPLAVRLRDPGGALYNVYGPTETTIWSTAAATPTRPTCTPMPVGVPLANTRGVRHRCRRAGTAAGPPRRAVRRRRRRRDGYPHRPDLTARAVRRRPGARPVLPHRRRGDARPRRHARARRPHRPADQAARHRIELGEVEAVLHAHPDVALAARDARRRPARSTAGWSPTCSRRPAPRRPRRGTTTGPFVGARPATPLSRVAAVPVRSSRWSTGCPTTPNGNVDRRGAGPRRRPRAGPAPSTGDAGSSPTPDRPVARRVAAPGHRADDNFFLSGGHSLNAVRMLAHFAEQTGAAVTLNDLLSAPTPADFARLVRETRA